ncbi:MAG: hypothetical protein M1816_004841 [Peltula sp. TS41687]|nr:MAG: hypothetical protein M1816_004841 [Peltula sp. TS41687]
MTENISNGAPGDPLSAKNSALNTGAALVQNFSPVKQICAHLNAFHAYASDPTRCVEANHYCSHVNDDVRQCLLYDSAEANARLLGVEYMVSPKVFATLDDEEKKLWHSHAFEVKSGMLIMPGPNAVPDLVWEKAENTEMEQVVGWYGKIYHFWQVDRGDPLPLGPPQLMTSYIAEDQIDMEKVVGARDRKFNVDYKHKADIRKHIAVPEIDSNADMAWKEDGSRK